MVGAGVQAQGQRRGPGGALLGTGTGSGMACPCPLRRTSGGRRPIRPGPRRVPGASPGPRSSAPGAAPAPRRTIPGADSGAGSRPRHRSQPQRVLRTKVLKMLAAMEQTPNSSRDPVEDFLTTGRTGRRNAMADILGQHASTGSGDLSERMEGLSTDQMAAGPSTSTAGASGQPGVPSPATTTAADAGPSKEAGR